MNTNRWIVVMLLLSGCSVVLLLSGCAEPYVPPPDDGEVVEINPRERECTLAFVLDCSGSFQGKMNQHGFGYQFFMRAVDQMFRARMNKEDSVLIAQISGNSRTLLWEGRPSELKRQFGSSRRLNQFLVQNADAGKSAVYANLATTLEFLAKREEFQSGESALVVLVLSDMLDNASTEDDRKRVVDALRTLKERKCSVGFYFVDQFEVETIRALDQEAGANAIIEIGINNNPPLPEWKR